MILDQKTHVLVRHNRTMRGFTLDEDYKIIEPLVLDCRALEEYKSAFFWWKPPCDIPAWAYGIRDNEFDTYWVK